MYLLCFKLHALQTGIFMEAILKGRLSVSLSRVDGNQDASATYRRITWRAAPRPKAPSKEPEESRQTSRLPTNLAAFNPYVSVLFIVSI
jgi:hypothetical protein